MSGWNRLSDIRLEDITDNSTRFDITSASPGPDTLQKQFTGLAIINSFVALFTFLVILSITRVKAVRKRPFNCYLLAVTFPDFIASFSCFITCVMSSRQAMYYSEKMCGFQTFYLVWGFTSTCWMNAVIAHKIYDMLKKSHSYIRYDPPTRKQIFIEAMCVYAYAAILASLATWNVPGLPFKGAAYQGFACFPKDYDIASTIFFWLGFVPLMLLMPLFYVLWCVIKIYKEGMIPPEGQRRTLGIYLSLTFIFVVMWLPFIVAAFIYVPISAAVSGGRDANPWILWIGAAWSHMQGLVSVWAIVLKQDIKDAFIGTITLGWWDRRVEREGQQGCCQSCLFQPFRLSMWDSDPNPSSTNSTGNDKGGSEIIAARSRTTLPRSQTQLRSGSSLSPQDQLNFASINEFLGGESQMMSIVEVAEDGIELNSRDSEEMKNEEVACFGAIPEDLLEDEEESNTSDNRS